MIWPRETLLSAAVVSILCLAPAPSQASLARTASLGGAGDLVPSSGWMVNDDANVYSFASLVAARGSRMDIEIGSLDLAGNYSKDGWAHLSAGGPVFGLPASVGLVVRRPETALGRSIWSDTTNWSPLSSREDAYVRTVEPAEPRFGISAGFAPAPGHRVGLLAFFQNTQAVGNSTGSYAAPGPGDSRISSVHVSRSAGGSAGYGFGGEGTLRSLDAAVHYQARVFDEHAVTDSWTSATDFTRTDYRSHSTSGGDAGITARAVVAVTRSFSAAGTTPGDWTSGTTLSKISSLPGF